MAAVGDDGLVAVLQEAHDEPTCTGEVKRKLYLALDLAKGRNEVYRHLSSEIDELRKYIVELQATSSHYFREWKNAERRTELLEKAVEQRHPELKAVT